MPGLGRGLGALLSESKKAHEERAELEKKNNAPNLADNVPPMPFSSSDNNGSSLDVATNLSGQGIENIDIDKLLASKFQPRRVFNDEGLNELASSIREHGLLEPLLVKNNSEGRYEIICGERRFRACKIAGIEKIPCIVRDVIESKAYAIALIENIQREDLNPLEQANALSQMLTECKMTQEELAKTLGKSRSTITNIIRINSLHEDVKNYISSGDLDLGHAKVLLGLDTNLQSKAADYIVKKGLSVRQTELFVKKLKESDDADDAKTKPPRFESFPIWENSISEKIAGIKAKFSGNGEDKGKLTLSYSSKEQLSKIIELFGIKEE